MMDYEQIQEIIAAHRAGREIEYRRNGSAVEERWLDWQYSKGRFDFNFHSYDYRIKPEPPKPREWWIRRCPSMWDDKAVLRYNTKEGATADICHLCEITHVREILPDEEGKA